MLVSCNAGNGISKTIGEYISQHPNIGTVYAPTSLTSYGQSPNLFSQAKWTHPSEDPIREKKLPGNFRIFNSASIE